MHIPVLRKEAIDLLNPQPNENFIDCNFGEGGHAQIVLERIKPEGKLLGIDFDPEVLKIAKLKFKDSEYIGRLILVCSNFSKLKEIAKANSFASISGILFDLGYSSWHLENSKRGFSFQRDEPLDMRYNPQCKLSAEEIVNSWPEENIKKILSEYGEEPFAENIARTIVSERKNRPIKKTFDLVSIVEKSIPERYRYAKNYRSRAYGSLRNRHFATKTFQALRIAVNDEISNLESALPQALDLLCSGGRLAVISFHSLEDRVVKNFFRDNTDNLKILTKKPQKAGKNEISANPRSRSAKLRVALKAAKP